MSKEIIAAIIGAVALIAAAFIALIPQYSKKSPESPNQLQIINLQLLDESCTKLKDDTWVLSKLVHRSTAYFSYQKAEDLKIAFMFKIKGYTIKDKLNIHLNGSISMVDTSGLKLAESPLVPLTHVSDWRKKSHVQALGVATVLRELNLPSYDTETSLIPIMIVLDRFKETEIPEKYGKLVVNYHDGVSNQTTEGRLELQFEKK